MGQVAKLDFTSAFAQLRDVASSLSVSVYEAVGMMTAVVSAPGLILPSDWLPALLGEVGGTAFVAMSEGAVQKSVADSGSSVTNTCGIVSRRDIGPTIGLWGHDVSTERGHSLRHRGRHVADIKEADCLAVKHLDSLTPKPFCAESAARLSLLVSPN